MAHAIGERKVAEIERMAEERLTKKVALMEFVTDALYKTAVQHNTKTA